MFVDQPFIKRKKQKNLTALQRKNLKKISKFNKEVLRESLPDVFILEKIQNKVPLRHEANNPLFLAPKITKDDSLFVLFLCIMFVCGSHAVVTISLKYVKSNWFGSVFPQLVHLFTNANYLPTCHIFGHLPPMHPLQKSVLTFKHYLSDTTSDATLSFLELCFLL